MEVTITITLNVENQDSTTDAFEAAQNQLRAMDIEDIIKMADYEVSTSLF